MSLKIYTRTGDNGHTGLFGGVRVPKYDLRVEAYGAVDELNAALGLAAVHPCQPDMQQLITRLQSELFELGADLAAPGLHAEKRGKAFVKRIRAEHVLHLEEEIDRYEAELEPLRCFILPGGSALAAALHWARVVCRRAERQTAALLHAHEQLAEPDVNPESMRYLNRLADLLFVLARAANKRLEVLDIPWTSEPAEE